MRKKRKLITLLSVFAVSSLILSGCGGNSSTDSAQGSDTGSPSGITLTLYGNSDDVTQPYMERIFELYEEKTGNTIDIQGIDSGNFESVCLTKFRTGDIPDILMHFGGYSLDAYNPAENFVDFSDAEWVSDIADATLSQTQRNGVVYGLPFWESSTSGFFYNKKIFNELNLSVPTTQKEFDEVCQKLLDAGVQPIYMAVGDGALFFQFGMDPIFADSELLEKLNSNQITYSDIPEMKSLIEWYQNCAEKGYLGENYATDAWNYCSEVLGKGEAAMMLCWDTWFYTDYDNESYEYKAEDFGIMPAFMGTKENGTYEGGNNSLLLVNKNSERVEAAIEFINFCADPENYNQAFDGICTAATLKGMTTNEMSSQYKEAQESILRLCNPSIANLEIVGFSQVDGGKCIQELLAGNIDAEECLKRMDEARIKVAASQNTEGF